MQKPLINIVWFKRDLRLSDHAPLQAAIEEGLPTLLCYFFEPTLLQSEESDDRHWRFVFESLQALREQLALHKQLFYLFHSEVLTGMEEIAQGYTINKLFSHQETGTLLTFDRDKSVKKWCQQKGIQWIEYRQDGVRRGLSHREGWEKKWEQDMQDPPIVVDLGALTTVTLPDDLKVVQSKTFLPLAFQTYQPGFQQGGAAFGWRYLRSFLKQRIFSYGKTMSKPLESRKSCSRLSPYIAYGTMSVREVLHQLQNYSHTSRLKQALENFHSRLWWRSHYIQKLESQWRMEFEPINPGFQALNWAHNDRFFEAWAGGHTGYPMVDASMRCLLATGWMNFRMRAMLATFAFFSLKLDWKKVATHLATTFLDFEPGIHFPQLQMQAGLTGYHPIRIYNPTLQSERNDPSGQFVRTWLPELSLVPTPLIYTPWKMTMMEQRFYKCHIGQDYPSPIVDHDSASRLARDEYWALRQQPIVQHELPAIWKRLCLPQRIAQYQVDNGFSEDKQGRLLG